MERVLILYDGSHRYTVGAADASGWIRDGRVSVAPSATRDVLTTSRETAAQLRQLGYPARLLELGDRK